MADTKENNKTKQKLNKLYSILLKKYGNQNWWPAKTKLEVIIGAILTQNTNWKNVERAISNLRANNLLNLQVLNEIKQEKLASLIKSSGYYNQKAKKIKNFINFLSINYYLNLNKFLNQDIENLRLELLSVNGIGKETADSIILYAANKPIFVIDAYTLKILKRLGFKQDNYDDSQLLFMNNLKSDYKLFNEYHALLVKLGKDSCNTNCNECDLCYIQNKL